MVEQRSGFGWWEVATVILAVNSVVFGFLFGSSGNNGWALGVGFAPGVLLAVGLIIRAQRRALATLLITISAISASLAFWMVYPVILGLAVVVGGFWAGKIGPVRTGALAA